MAQTNLIMWQYRQYSYRGLHGNDNSPVFTSSSTFTAEENQLSIGTVVHDADSDPLTYSVSGTDASALVLVEY